LATASSVLSQPEVGASLVQIQPLQPNNMSCYWSGGSADWS